MNTNIADRPLSLAGHLHRVANLMNQQLIVYDWRLPDRCNCGLLALSITGLTMAELRSHIDSIKSITECKGSWVHLASQVCPITGVPMDLVFKKLHHAGMQIEDYGHLENLSDRTILARFKKKDYHMTIQKKRFLRNPIDVEVRLAGQKDDRLSVVGYMFCWADMITEYRMAHPDPVPTDAQLERIESRPLVAQ